MKAAMREVPSQPSLRGILSGSHAFTLLLICLVSLIGIRVFSTRYFHLRGIPGPYGATLSRLWLLKTLASEDCSNIYVQLNQRYGELVPSLEEKLTGLHRPNCTNRPKSRSDQ